MASITLAPRRRAGELILGLGLLGLSVASAFVAYAVVFCARIGPVAMTLDAAAGRGVHVGDLLALPLAALAAATFVAGIGALDRPTRCRVPWRN